MILNEKYLEALKSFDDYVTVLQWAEKVAEIYPNVLKTAEKQAHAQKNKTTGLKEIAARIGARISTNKFNNIKVDLSEKPRKVKYVTQDELDGDITQDVEDDIAPLTRNEIIERSKQSLESINLYRVQEFKDIQSMFKKFLGIDLEIDHAKALQNKTNAGEHHPDNLQLLLRHHNAKKNNNNWNRFSFEEQKEYILKVIELQKCLDGKLKLSTDENIVNSLVDRLKKVF